MTEPQVMPAEADKLDFKRILPIFLIVLVDLLGLTIIIPLLPLYAAAFGADPFTVGLLAAAYPLMQLIGGPLLGGLSDRFGRRPVLIVSQIGTFTGFILLGIANGIPLLFCSRILDGLTGGNIVTAKAAIADSTTERTRAQGLGLIGAAFGLGFTIGPAIAGIALALTDNDYRAPAFIAAGFSLLSIVLTTVYFKETLPPEACGRRTASAGGSLPRRLAAALNTPTMGVLLVLMFMQQFVFGGFQTLLPLFTLSRLGLGAAENAALFVFIGALLVVIQGKYIGPWSRRFGERRLIYAGLGLLAGAMLLTALTPQQTVPGYSRAEFEQVLSAQGAPGETGIVEVAVPLPPDDSPGWLGLVVLVLAMIPATISGGILSPSINSLITRQVEKTEVGSALGLSSALVSAGNAFMPIVGGLTFQVLGPSAPFFIGALLMTVMLVYALRRIQPEPPNPAGARNGVSTAHPSS